MADEGPAWFFLGYLVVPLVILFLFWLVGFIRRKLRKQPDDVAVDNPET